jgi:ferredoxin
MNSFILILSAAVLIARLQPCQSFAFQPPSLRPPTVGAQQQIVSSSSRLFLSDEPNEPEADDSSGIDVSEDERLYRIRLPRAAGIEWGTDLSFSFVYVRDMESSEPAALSGMVLKGDQICEIKEDGKKAINLLGAPFDYVMDAFSGLGKTTKEIDMVFFHGTKEELKEVCTGNAASADPDMITITVIQNKGADDEQLHKFVVPAGSNIREVCVDNGINVYQSVTRWTNCKGKQLCGTCIVNVAQGALFTNRKSMDEGSTLRENPDSYRLSCVAFAYGDVTVETFPPINAAQWTR